MKKLSKIFENTMAAVAFAEENETETARHIMKGEDGLNGAISDLREKVHTTVDDLISVAITFAEAGEHNKAVEILGEAEERLKKIKLNHQGAFRNVLSVRTN